MPQELSKDTNTGLGPLLDSPEPFFVNGKGYKFRNIGLADGKKLINILNTLYVNGSLAGSHVFPELYVDDSNEGAIKKQIVNIILGMTSVSDSILQFIASILKTESGKQVTIEQLEDPDLFPIDSFYDLVEQLSQHPNVKTFFGRSKLALLKNPLTLWLRNQMGQNQGEEEVAVVNAEQ